MRIHFTLTDLARTRLAGEASPLTVTTFSVFRLAHSPGPPALDIWRRAVGAGLKRSAYPLFSELTPTHAAAPVPRLLRPHSGLRTLEDELERLRSTPRQALGADLGYVARHRPLSAGARDLANGDRAATARLADSVRSYHQVAVAPYWRGLAAMLAADRAARTRQLRDHGIEKVLDTLTPRIRWRPPVLEVETPADSDYDYRLGGRGLLLAPGAFSSYLPCDQDEEQPTLYYEVADHSTQGHQLLAGAEGPHDALAALLGHSRAAVLEVIAEGVSTGRLARRAGLSPASASEHATVLRRAGLVTTDRSGRNSHHSLTPLGRELLQHAVASSAAPRS